MKSAAFLLTVTLVASSGRIVTFDGNALGKVPPGWSVSATRGPSRWEVRKDESAPVKPFVLAQTSSGIDGDFPLAIFSPLTLRDGDVSVRLKPVGGSRRTGGLIFRYRDPNNYYVAQADLVQQTVSLFKVVNGRRVALANPVKHDLPANDWRILKISVTGMHISVYLDHRRILQADDNTYLGFGQVGLCSEDDTITYFNDFRVNPK